MGAAGVGHTSRERMDYNTGMPHAISHAHVRDVSDAEFDTAVIARSREVPVLVDFWAEWCGPCRMLGPVLEKLAGERNGELELAKVDTDRNPASAARYQVRGIPHVVLFKGGQPVDQFVGARPEDAVRAFLRKHVPSAADRHMALGLERLAAGDAAGAEAALQQALAVDPAHAGARLGLARLALQRRDGEAMRTHLRHIPPMAPEHEAGTRLEEAAELIDSVSGAGDEAAVAARVASQPDDLEARFALGVHHLAAGRYREALDAFLAVVERDRRWRDEAARRAMLTVFGLVGVRDPLADEYRRKLMIYT
jgi:putative thioredoxin